MAERLMQNVDVCCCDKCHANMAALFAVHRRNEVTKIVRWIEKLSDETGNADAADYWAECIARGDYYDD
jgi:hypothetical protein